VARVVELLVEQSVAGLSTLVRETKRWLRSAQREEIDQRPLARLQNPESQARYGGYIIMFTCYVLRIIADEEIVVTSDNDSDTSDDESTDGSESSGRIRSTQLDILKDARELFRWQGRQKELAKKLWDTLNGSNEKLQIATLLQLLTSFIFEGTGDDPFNSGLVHFLAVLGIDAQTGRLRTAKNYSYMLAGVVYCTRVIAIEALLPAAERAQQTSADRDEFLRKRGEFLADGSYSPMSDMLSLLAYGKFVAMNAGNSGNAMWLKDKRIFYLNGRPIFISRFQQMVRDVITEAEDIL
jgi:hypothetical protein